MDDVFLSDPRQASAKEMAIKKQLKKPHKRRFRHYIFDFIVKSLIIAILLSINFTLFAESGGYNLFNASGKLTPEASWLYVAIIIFSGCSIFLVSFSLTLENILIAMISASFTFALLNQFALFDINSFLLQYIQPLTNSFVDILSKFSHIIIAGIVFIIVWFIFSLLSRRAQLYLFFFALLIEGGLLLDAYSNQVSRSFEAKSFLNDESSHSDSHNIIFIALPNAPTYNNLINLDLKSKQSDIKQAAYNVLGFYLQNNFTYYPNAYLHNLGLPFLNLTEHLNLNHTDNIDNLLSSELVLNNYWDFKHLRQDKLYLRQNRLFDKLHKQDYNLRIYQGHGIELCTINNNLAVNRCLQKIDYPISFNETDMKFGQKVSLLATQWLESTGLISGINPILGVFSAFNSEVTPLRFLTKELSPYNAFNVLDIITEDINQDKGNNLYFTVLDLPSDLYMYDSLCNLKPLSRWVSANDKTTALAIQQSAYAEQVSCLYGKLENFIRNLKNNNKLTNTTIIIDGISPAFTSIPGIEKDIFKAIQNTKQAGLAIYDSSISQPNIDNRICLSSSIIRNHFNKDDNCIELEDLPLADNVKTDILQTSKENAITNKQSNKAKSAFNSWYQTWAAYNQVNIPNTEEIIPLEKITPEPTISEEKIVDTITTAVAEELPEETATKPLSSISTENKTTASITESATKEAPLELETLPKPEQLKKEFRNKQETQEITIEKVKKSPQINVEAKVIENTDVKDVVPPFVLGEIKYQDAETNKQ